MHELLSISIPTRNRAKCLSDLLSDISASVMDGCIDASLLKIYIFDNASTDNTGEIVDTFKASLPISYKKNEENIGMGLNIFQAYTAIEGEYVWVIGDDDLLPRQAISVIFNLIKKYTPTLIIPRVLSYKATIKLPQRYSSYSEFAKSMQEMNPHFLIAHTLISANIIKRVYFDKKAALAAMDTYYGHSYGIASGLKNNNGLIILPEEETVIVRSKYLGPVDGFWPDTIEKEQVKYLEWLKDEYELSINPSRIVPDYLEKIKQNIFVRGVKYIDKRFLRSFLKKMWFHNFVQK